jgi:hypothetical protein
VPRTGHAIEPAKSEDPLQMGEQHLDQLAIPGGTARMRRANTRPMTQTIGCPVSRGDPSIWSNARNIGLEGRLERSPAQLAFWGA